MGAVSIWVLPTGYLQPLIKKEKDNTIFGMIFFTGTLAPSLMFMIHVLSILPWACIRRWATEDVWDNTNSSASEYFPPSFD